MNTRKWTFLWIILVALALGSGCVYRQNIAQGNLVKEEDIAQVEVGSFSVRQWLPTRFTTSAGTTSTT